MAEKRCYGCMRPMEGPVCPVCGWQEDRHNEPHQLQPGTLLRGQYEIGKVLGQGGFGITYLGWDRHLETAVCIKEYFPSHAVSRDCTVSDVVHCHTEQAAQSYHISKARFLREAKVLAQFRDIPEIVGIYNFFEENNTAYIVMEYIRGTDLAHYIQRKGGRLSAEETFRILRPIMQAMAAVHRGELVHRDIAPDNIMLHPRGGAKLLDFGAARMVENADVDRGLNRSTEAIVKHGFAPMEQYQTRGNLGPWTDVYAMCATVYYCLTGQIPPEATSRMMGDAELDWNQVPGLTNQQRYALDRGMAIHARDRYASMEELMEGLFSANPNMTNTQVLRPQQRIPNAPAAPAPAPRKKKKKGLVFGIIAAVLVLAVAAGGLMLGQLSKPAPAPTEAPMAPAPMAEAPAEPIRNKACYLQVVTGSGNTVYGDGLYNALSLPGYDVTCEWLMIDSVDAQVELIMSQWESGATIDAIVWAPGGAVPEDRLRLVQETADATGVPVILVGLDPSYETGSCPLIENSYRLCYAGADPRTVGRRLIQALEFTGMSKADVNSDGRIGYLFLGHEQAPEDYQLASQEIVNTLESIGMAANSLEQLCVAPTEKGGHEAVSRVYGFYMNQLEVIFCMDEAIARGAVMALEELGIVIGQDVFIVTVGDDGLRDMVNSGTFAGGVKGSYELQYAAINQALLDGLRNSSYTEKYYRTSCELVVPGTSAATPTAAPTDEWENAPDGIRIDVYTGDSYEAYVMLVRDPSQVYLATSTQGNFSSNIPGARINEIMEAEGGIAAVNAGAFFDDGSALPSVGATPEGLVIAGGEVRWNSGSAPEPELEAFVGFDSQNRLVVAENMTAEKARELGIRDGCVYGPILIENGKANDAQELETSGLNPRTAIGQRADGTVILVSVVGRRAESMGATYADLVEIMRSYGAVNACNLAGSSAATMAYRDTYGIYGDAGEIAILNAHTSGSRQLPTYWMVSGVPAAGQYIARGVVTAESLNYRSEPKTDARSLGKYSRGTVLNFLVIENGWGLTDDGWVVMSYIQLEEQTQSESEDGVIWGMVSVAELNVHAAPSMESESGGFIVYGTQVEILEVQEVGGRQWGLIDQGWIRGWILMAYVEIGGVR